MARCEAHALVGVPTLAGFPVSLEPVLCARPWDHRRRGLGVGAWAHTVPSARECLGAGAGAGAVPGRRGSPLRAVHTVKVGAVVRPRDSEEWQRKEAAATSAQRERNSGSRTKEHISTLSGLSQDAEENNEGGEARGLDKGISVYSLPLPGASAREARSRAKQHHVSSVSPSRQEPSSFFIQQVFIELKSTRQWARCPGENAENERGTDKNYKNS